MVQLVTASGVRTVSSWGYQLQGNQERGELLDPRTLLEVPHDLIVMDFSADGLESGRYLGEDIEALKARSPSSVVLAYMSIGEASDYRTHWDRAWTSTGMATGTPTAKAPTWLGPNNPAWPNSRKVRYWEEGWQDIIYNDRRSGWLDLIAAQGFDGAYLDIVDAYVFWGGEVAASARRPDDPKDERDAARRMTEFIADLTAHIRDRYRNFMIVPQNGEMILDALGDPSALAVEDQARKAMFLKSVSAIAVEDVYCPGEAPHNNPLSPVTRRIEMLKRDFLANRKPVLSVDYINAPDLAGAYLAQCAADGFVPYAAPSRNLDRLGPAFEGDIAASAVTRSKGGAPTGPRSGEPRRSMVAPRLSWYPSRANAKIRG